MQQELIEMLEEIIPYVEVWHKEDQDVIDRAEALVEKAKNNNAPAVPVYQLAKLGGPTETAWIDVTQEVYEDAGFYKDDFKRRILSATPAPVPAQEFNKSVADAEIKAMYVESQGSDKGWLGIEGSYFIGGVVAARKQKAAPAPAQEVGLTDEERADMACAVAAICTGASSRTVAATAIEWTERALREKQVAKLDYESMYCWLTAGKRGDWIWNHVLTDEEKNLGNDINLVVIAALRAKEKK